MPFEIGERVVFRSLHWEVADSASESYIELFGRSHENQGRTVRVILGFEPIQRAQVPTLEWTLGAPRWDHTEWKALHDAYRLTLSHGPGHLASVDWGRLILEPYQLVPLRRIENLPFPRLMLADDTGLGKTAEAGLILFRLMQRRRWGGYPRHHRPVARLGGAGGRGYTVGGGGLRPERAGGEVEVEPEEGEGQLGLFEDEPAG